MVYFTAIPRDGLYEIEMSCSNTNNSSMYAVSNKSAKLNLDSSLLWHCRLGHISRKRIEKLQHDGLLNSSDIESLGKCVSCMSGKMARKPYSHQVKRAKDLLGLIHADVYGPFRIVSRQRAILRHLFTDDFKSLYWQAILVDLLKKYGVVWHLLSVDPIPTNKLEPIFEVYFLRISSKENDGLFFLYNLSENKVLLPRNVKSLRVTLVDLRSKWESRTI
ncbi:retrotransposon protein, putative, ty1-copia subclass [Tanacetum coccineum]